jgi:hypothetical protein
MKDELDYPNDIKVDLVCAFSVFTHMEPEDIYVSLRKLMNSAHAESIALVTFLPLEHEFGEVNFVQEAERRMSDHYNLVRNVSMTKSQATEIASLAG